MVEMGLENVGACAVDIGHGSRLVWTIFLDIFENRPVRAQGYSMLGEEESDSRGHG